MKWTHFRSLLRVADEDARYWYLQEASKEMWSTRTLDRNIGSQYYYRLLQAPKKDAVIEEMLQLTEIIKRPAMSEANNATTDVVKDGGLNGGKVGGLQLTERQRTILELIKQNPKVTLEEIAKSIGASVPTASRETTWMQENKVIKRTSKNRYGEWVIVYDNL